MKIDIKKINELKTTKWIARILITHNFIFSIIIKTSLSEYFMEGFPLIIISIWLTWFNKNISAVIFMLICFYTFYMHF
jgi:hypothetical protein